MTKQPPDHRGINLSRIGQPRWIASKSLRAAGWASSCALKNPDGSYMTAGQAYDAVNAINRMIADYDAGLSISHCAFAHLAPRTKALSRSTRTIGNLAQAWLNSNDFQELRPNSRRSYSSFLSRLLECLAMCPDGHPDRQNLHGAALEKYRLRYETNMLKMAKMDINELLDPNLWEKIYSTLKTQINPQTGLPQLANANHIIRTAKAWLTWIRKTYKTFLPFHPLSGFDMIPTSGRVVIWTRDEIKSFCDYATNLGWHSQSLAVELALELSWSQSDLLALRFGQFIHGIGHDNNGKSYPVMRVRGTRSKTGNMTHTTLTKTGRALYDRAVLMWRFRNGHNENSDAVPSPSDFVLVVDSVPGRAQRSGVGNGWKPDYFKHTHATLRAGAGIQGKTFADLRDTAFTMAMEAGLNEHETLSRTQHRSPESVRLMGQKHYGMTTTKISDAAARKLEGANT